MSDRADTLLAWLITVPDELVYLFVGLAAALENVIPPVPADVVVVLAGVVAGAGGADARIVFLAVWLSNVGTALAVYGLGRRYGAALFSGSFGRLLLGPNQVVGLAIAYRRFGFPIIFLSRFLPIFRPIVPVFAGVARLGFWRTALPLATASAIWYGSLVALGAYAGENWQMILDFLGAIGFWLWTAAATLLGLLLWWWWRTRTLAHRAGADSG